ncbi:MAG TPA: bifunctional oligoribonuclease/PAP phosphatase NrnA [Alphaproteobacteria bacterium]|nr:bifunctional oligoribonuclease/PAP phosphatase NrnA [Alphaproteobacteria bacterium]
MDQLNQILEHIGQRRKFLVTSHARPDGDAVGSVLALSEILRQMGKDVDVVLRDPVPVIYQPLPFSERITQLSHVNGGYDAAILLECDSVQRTRLQGLEPYFLMNIDHHVSAKAFAHVNWIDSSACATAELVAQLATQAGIKITPEIATCLYTAVLTDTGSFCYEPTNARTFALAKFLVEHGAEPAKIAQHVYFSNPVSKMRLLGVALSRLVHEGPLAWATITREDMQRSGALDEDSEGVVNYVLSIAGVEVAMLLREIDGDRIRASLRSKGTVNVAAIAEVFGGGGHECASGFSLQGPLAAAATRVLAEVKRKLSKAV